MLKKYFEPGALLSYSAYRNLIFSNILTIIAMSAFPIALAVTILDAGGSASTLGIILAVRVLSSVLFAPIGGVWSDRLPRKTILIFADLSRAIVGSIVGEGTHIQMYLGVGNAMIHAPFNRKTVRLKMMSEEQAARVIWTNPSRIATYRL